MPKRKGSHLTTGDRNTINVLLKKKHSLRYISQLLGCSPSTISREIKNHAVKKNPKMCDCVHFRDCTVRDLCDKGGLCRKLCRTCQYAKKKCSDYTKAYCQEAMDDRTGVCNFCEKWHRDCGYEKCVYDPDLAQKEADVSLHDSRSGRNITDEHMDKIDQIVSPLLKQGQSAYHIIQNHGKDLGISESTLRRMVNDCELDARRLDLRDAVKRKPRRKKPDSSYKTMKVIKEGRKYEDFLRYIAEQDTFYAEMDCVEGKKDEPEALLTLHFPLPHLQIAVILNAQTTQDVVKALDMLESHMGPELFAECFPVILTDNGHEFADIDEMERSVSGGQRTKIFFCEPNRSDQKGHCENNHKYIRYVIPKGTSLHPYSQADICLMMDHINSFARKSLGGKTPYQAGRMFLPEDFFLMLGLEEIPADEVILTPDLLKR